jgi:membrane protein CcdC involved in cytochrome C biogenesis
MDHHKQQMISYAIYGALIAVVLFFRMRRLTQERRLKLELMWIMPALMVAAMIALFLQFPPHGSDWSWLGAVFVVGAGVGWMRGKLIPISIDPETHFLNTKPSPAALIFLLGLFVIRFALRAYLESNASALHISIGLLTDGFVVLAVGLFAVSRIEMALRAWSLLKAARAAKAAA